MIRVGRASDENSYYIGRPGPLGNPFFMRNESERNYVCDQYEKWFYEQLNKNNAEVFIEIRKLLRLAESKDLVLGCYCYPKRCHGDTIKKYLDSILDYKQVVNSNKLVNL